MSLPPAQPAYLKIADELRAGIQSGQWPAGHRLPSELELGAHFGVARMTLRQALDILQLEGLIDRRRGRNGGTFVSGLRPLVELTRIEGFMPQLRARGLSVTSTVLQADLVHASAQVAEALQLSVADPVFQVIRLRLVNLTPMLIENSYFPAHLMPGMLSEDLDQSLYELIESKWGLRPVRKTEQISPGVASGWEQTQLGVGRSIALLRITRIAETVNRVPVEYSEDALRPDVTQIVAVTGDRDRD